MRGIVFRLATAALIGGQLPVGRHERLDASLLRCLIVAAGADPGDQSAPTALELSNGNLKGAIALLAWRPAQPERPLHTHDKAARQYIKLTAPDKLYATWEAFGL